MRGQPLPRALQEKWGHLRFIQYQAGDEWSSECPKCRDYGHYGNDKPDRFRMWAASAQHGERGWCRRCGHFEWADDPGDGGPSPEAIAAAEAERTRLAKLEMERQQAKIEAIEQAAYWKAWHEQMTDEQRELWRQQGIIDYFIDLYNLGYVTHHTYYHDGQEWRSPAMTIPHYGDDWHLTNIQYRLTEPAPGAGKYRQTAGLPAAMFRTEPDEELRGPVMIVEGAKKAIVTYTHVGHEPFSVVGIPSKTPSSEMIEQLDNCEPIYLALDPDAYISDGHGAPAANRAVKKLGRERTRVIRLPVKPDDLFVLYGGDAHDFMRFVKQARAVT